MVVLSSSQFLYLCTQNISNKSSLCYSCTLQGTNTMTKSMQNLFLFQKKPRSHWSMLVFKSVSTHWQLTLAFWWLCPEFGYLILLQILQPNNIAMFYSEFIFPEKLWKKLISVNMTSFENKTIRFCILKIFSHCVCFLERTWVTNGRLSGKSFVYTDRETEVNHNKLKTTIMCL